MKNNHVNKNCRHLLIYRRVSTVMWRYDLSPQISLRPRTFCTFKICQTYNCFVYALFRSLLFYLPATAVDQALLELFRPLLSYLCDFLGHKCLLFAFRSCDRVQSADHVCSVLRAVALLFLFLLYIIIDFIFLLYRRRCDLLPSYSCSLIFRLVIIIR